MNAATEACRQVARGASDALVAAATTIRHNGRVETFTADEVADLLTALAADFHKTADEWADQQ